MSSASLVGTKGVPRAERESQIVAVAVDEFAARGYAGASMVEIALANRAHPCSTFKKLVPCG